MASGRLRFGLQYDDKIFLAITTSLVIFSVVQSFFDFPSYYLTFVSNVLIFAIFALAYNLLHGHTGIISFGHAGFYVIGAYAGALTWEFASNNVWLGFLSCLVISGIFSFIVGFLAVRIRGIYFALLTLAFSMIPFLAIRGPLSWLTGGGRGWQTVYPPAFLFDLGNPLKIFFLILGTLILVYMILRVILNSHFGQNLKCIKDNELKLEGLGYDTRRIKYIAVTISGTLSGVAGYLFLIVNLSVAPHMGNYFISAKVIFCALLGGVNTLVGPILGTFVWYLIDEFLVVPGFLEITLGIALLLIVLRFSEGVAGLVRRWVT